MDYFPSIGEILDGLFSWRTLGALAAVGLVFAWLRFIGVKTLGAIIVAPLIGLFIVAIVCSILG